PYPRDFVLLSPPFTSLPTSLFFFFTATSPTQIYTLSLHDALPISLKTSVRRPRICAAISRPLYPSRGHLQPSPGLLHRWPGHLSLARFGSPQSTEAQNPIGRQVLTSLLTAHPSERLRAHSTFRLSGQPPAHQASAALLSVAGLETTAASGTPRFLHRRGSWSLSLPQLWRTNEGHR